jgi:hypothetical protein
MVGLLRGGVASVSSDVPENAETLGVNGGVGPDLLTGNTPTSRANIDRQATTTAFRCNA